MVLAQLWLTGRSKKETCSPQPAQRKGLLFGFPLWQPQNVSWPTAKAVLCTSSCESKILFSLMSPELHAPSLFGIPIHRALKSHESTFTRTLLVPKANGEGRQKEMKCLAQHHTGNLWPSPAPSSAPRSNHSRPRSRQSRGRERRKNRDKDFNTLPDDHTKHPSAASHRVPHGTKLAQY